MEKGNINRLMELLIHNMQNDVVPINELTLVQLKQNHPQNREAYPEVLLSDIPKEIHLIRFHSIASKSKKQNLLQEMGLSVVQLIRQFYAVFEKLYYHQLVLYKFAQAVNQSYTQCVQFLKSSRQRLFLGGYFRYAQFNQQECLSPQHFNSKSSSSKPCSKLLFCEYSTIYHWWWSYRIRGSRFITLKLIFVEVASQADNIPKIAAYTDDLTVAGSIIEVKNYCNMQCRQVSIFSPP